MILYYSPLYLWYLVMFTRPHKEERFLFVVYPIIILGAAIVIVVYLIINRKLKQL